MGEILEVLRVVTASDTALSLKEIQSRVKHLQLETRTLQRILNKLIKSNRIKSIGAASSTRYWQKDVREAYAKEYRLLFVHKKERVAGYLFFNPGNYIFCYTDQYLLDGETAFVGMPLRIEAYVSTEIPVAFDENLPEGINREILERALKSGNDFDILSRLSHNIGDIYFTLTGESQMPAWDASPSFLMHEREILGSNTFPSILENHRLDLPENEIFPEGGDLTSRRVDTMPGISGFQYKKLLSYDREGRRFHQESDTEVREYIFKPYSRLRADPDSEYYLPHLALNEHLFMSFAKNELGFRVPESHLLRRADDEEYHYIVKRFDRYGAYRFAKANFSTYLGLRAENKYQTTSEKMFRRIKREIIHPAERMELLKYYFYSMMISHEDMHTKNLSILLNGDIVIMAPLYDVACTRIYTNTKGYDTHLMINGRHNKIRPKDFRPLVEILDVPVREFMAEAFRIVECFQERMPEYIQRVRQLGELEFYTMKQVKRAGRPTEWRKNKKKNFADVLDDFRERRIDELRKLGWMKS